MGCGMSKDSNVSSIAVEKTKGPQLTQVSALCTRYSSAGRYPMASCVFPKNLTILWLIGAYTQKQLVQRTCQPSLYLSHFRRIMLTLSQEISSVRKHWTGICTFCIHSQSP